MNLNEECLLQYLKSDRLTAPTTSAAGPDTPTSGALSEDLQRIFRRSRYVSFPQAILIRRPPLLP